MSKRRGWQIAAVSGLWLSYGGFVIWPLVYAHVGDRLFIVPLALALGLLGWATVKLRRSIAAHQSRFRHWETRFPIESLFVLLLALMVFVVDVLAVIATQHSLVDAPFAQIGWFILIFALLAILLIFVGGLSYLALQTPMPAPGGYRDARSKAEVTAPPGSTTVTSPTTNKLLFDVSHQDGIQQLWIIGIFLLAICTFLSPLPYEVPMFIVTIGFSWGIWHLIGIYPSRANIQARYYILHVYITTCLLLFSIILISITFNEKSSLGFLAPMFQTLIRIISLLLVLGLDNYYRAVAAGKTREAKRVYETHYLTVFVIFFLIRTFSEASWPLILGISAWLVEFVFLAFVLGIHIVSSIRALRMPAQPEVVA